MMPRFAATLFSSPLRLLFRHYFFTPFFAMLIDAAAMPLRACRHAAISLYLFD